MPEEEDPEIISNPLLMTAVDFSAWLYVRGTILWARRREVPFLSKSAVELARLKASHAEIGFP
jgi:hypothetical protein